jgi:hypothetical protein
MRDRDIPNEATHWRWLWILGLIAAIDLVLRFGIGFRMREVATVEAVLFAGGALTLYLMRRRTPPAHRHGDRLQIALMLALALAAERVTLWRAGTAISVANLATLVTAFVLLGVWLVRRRTRQHAPTA